MESIPERDDIEIIIVDDNSDSAIVNFDLFPGTGDPRVKILLSKEERGGTAYAKNIGLRHARGKWIVFSDADDYFTRCFNDILSEYAKSDYDMIFFKNISVNSNTYIYQDRGSWYNNTIDRFFDNPRRGEFDLRYNFATVTCKLYRKSFFDAHHIMFDNALVVCEDDVFSPMVGFYASKITADKRAMYCITVRSHSLSTTTYKKNVLVAISAYAKREMFFREKKIPVKESLVADTLLYLLLHEKAAFKKAPPLLIEIGFTKTEINLKILAAIAARFFRICKFPLRVAKKMFR